MNHHHSCCVSANNSLCFFTLFLDTSMHINVAGLGRVKLKQNLLHAVSQEAGEAGHSPALPFLVRGTLSSWQVPSRL